MIFFKYLFNLPHFLFWYFNDRFLYWKNKGGKEFYGFGLHLYVGKFGSGKTLAMVRRAYKLALRYPQLTIVSNVALSNFPKHTVILPLTKPQDILDAPVNSLILIDEIGTIFNSRDFASRDGLPKVLFQHICQCRKRKLMVLATTQCWNFLDKQLRDITFEVISCRSFFTHPFTRITGLRYYDAVEYDLAYNNLMYPLKPLVTEVFISTDKIRALYDTSELIVTLLSKKYISDEEIMASRGEQQRLAGDSRKTVKKL